MPQKRKSRSNMPRSIAVLGIQPCGLSNRSRTPSALPKRWKRIEKCISKAPTIKSSCLLICQTTTKVLQEVLKVFFFFRLDVSSTCCRHPPQQVLPYEMPVRSQKCLGTHGGLNGFSLCWLNLTNLEQAQCYFGHRLHRSLSAAGE